MIDFKAIPVITARGSHYEVGGQIGSQMADNLKAVLDQAKRDLPLGASWEAALTRSNRYLPYSREVYPQYIRELEGIAEGAEVVFDELFALMCEVLWDRHNWPPRTPVPGRGCTDIAARGRATRDGATLLGHTNDELPDHENHLVILKVQAEDEPEFLGVSSGGAAISAGYNAAGISLTGNQLDSNDNRPGVPRLIMVRAMLGARRLGEALDICALPQRASNYNNIVADASGEIFSMEGSATDVEAIYIEDDVLAHANHYTSLPMRKFEVDRSYLGDSCVRHHRAARLLCEKYGEITPEVMMDILKDHTNFPASICKHGTITQTAYSIVIELDKLRCWIGKGRPCQTEYREFRLDPWPGANGG